MTNEQKANEIALSNDIYDTTEVYQSDVVDMLMQMAQWKDEQSAKEKQQFVNLACESFCDNCRQQYDCRLTACLNMYGFREKLIKKLQL